MFELREMLKKTIHTKQAHGKCVEITILATIQWTKYYAVRSISSLELVGLELRIILNVWRKTYTYLHINRSTWLKIFMTGWRVGSRGGGIIISCRRIYYFLSFLLPITILSISIVILSIHCKNCVYFYFFKLQKVSWWIPSAITIISSNNINLSFILITMWWVMTNGQLQSVIC